MNNKKIGYFSVHVRTDKDIIPMAAEQSKGHWLGLTANIRLSIHDHAYIETREIAEQLVAACVPVFDRRYGKEGYAVEINEQHGYERYAKQKIEKDTQIILERLRTGNMAPNKPVQVD